MSSGAGEYVEVPGNWSRSCLCEGLGGKRWGKSDESNWCMVESRTDSCLYSCTLSNRWDVSTGGKLSHLLCVILHSTLLQLLFPSPLFSDLPISVLQRVAVQLTANFGMWSAMSAVVISVFPWGVASEHRTVINSPFPQRLFHCLEG